METKVDEIAEGIYRLSGARPPSGNCPSGCRAGRRVTHASTCPARSSSPG
jgi:hypothetical protein